MEKLINPRTGEEQVIEIRIIEPVARELDAVVVIEGKELEGER